MIVVTDSETMAERGVSIQVLGPVEVTVNGGVAPLGGPKQRAVFAMLVSRVGRVVTTDELVDGVWGEDPPGAVLSSIHTYISNLRTGVDYPIERHGSGYLLDAERTEIDGFVFEEGIEVGRKDLVANPATAAEGLRQALALWKGRAYSDVATFPGLYNEAIRLEELRLSAVEARIEADLALGRHGAVVGELEALAAEHPLRESLRAKHMLALYREGRQGEALRAFRRTREYLRDELGVDPSEELQELEERILNHDYTLIQSREVINERLALLFTDIVHSTLLWETHPTEMQVALAHHDDLVQDAIDQAGGTVIKSLGDGFIAAFSETTLAARAAVVAQQALAARDWTPLDFTVRMAIDTGEVERRGGDLFGPPMNRGSRLLAAAHGSQILLSSDAQSDLGRDPGTQIKSLGGHRFKGIGPVQDVYQLVVKGLPVDFPSPMTSGTTVDVDRDFGDAICGYELRERVGRGAFATVYRAYQPSIGREVAIKIIRPEFANHPAFVRRFESEARFVASLEHPHIVSVYDYWRDAEGAYLVAPFLARKSLADDAVGTLPVDQVLKIANQVGSALSYAHRHGVLHRDIKPANILIDGDGNAYLADFGIAARAVEAATGVVSASAGYRAPEDHDGAPVDARSDIYSLAAVIARLLTGVQPDSFDFSALDHRLRTALEHGLATEPEARPETVEQFMELLAASSAAPAPTRIPTIFRNPYKGLAAFREPDAEDFFGRADEIRRAVAMVGEHRLSAVVGPSGSGKSSLVLAGLLPALRAGAAPGSETWMSVRAVPGGYPFDELATSLSAVATESLSDLADELSAADEKGLLRVSKRIGAELDGELVVVVDQFEELFTLVTSEETRERFVSSLVSAAGDQLSRVRIVLTLRADFFHEALAYPTLGPIISHAHLALAPLDASQAREAIVAPAGRAGLELEPGLTDRIISDLANQPGSLPLLQYTLDRLANAAGDGLLTNAHYDELGGVKGAMAERAEAAFQKLSDDQQEVSRHIFTRLLTVSDDADDLRRRVRVTEFRSLGLRETDVDEVLGTFGKERLLTFDVDPTTRGATVEVAHEALLREWPALRSWVDSRREALVLQRRFQTAHSEWEDSDRDPANLLTGGRLTQFEEWASGDEVRLTTAEHEFLDASVARRADELGSRRTRRRLILGGFAVAACVALVLAVVAMMLREQAETEARGANIRRLVGESTLTLTEDPERSLLLALEGAYLSREAGEPLVPETVTALHRAVQTSRLELTIDGGQVLAAISPDGTLLVVDGHQELEVRDAETGVRLGSIESGNEAWRPRYAVFSPDGSLLAISYLESAEGGDRLGHVSIRESGTWQEVTTGEEIGIVGVPLAFADNETVVVHEPREDRILFLDIRSGTEIDSIDGVELDIADSFAHLGTELVVSNAQGIQKWDLASRERLWATDHDGWVLAISPVTGMVASGGFQGEVWLHDPNDGTIVATLRGHTGPPRAGAFYPDGERLATAQQGGGTRVWDVSPDGAPEVGALAIDFAPYGLLFSPEGDATAASLLDSQVAPDSFVYADLATGTPYWSIDLWDYWAFPAAVNADWTMVALVDSSGEPWVHDLMTGARISPLPSCTSPRAMSPDGSAVVVDGVDSNLVGLCRPPVADRRSRVIDTASGDELLDLTAIDVGRAAFNPGGVLEPGRYVAIARIAPAGQPRPVEIFDVVTGELVGQHTPGADETTVDLRFDPTGRYLAGGTINGRAFVLDLAAIVDGVPAEEALVFDQLVATGIVPGVRLNAEGVLVTSAFGSLRLWNIHSQELLYDVPINIEDLPPGAAFNPDGDIVYYADTDYAGYVLRKFHLDADALIELAESRVTSLALIDE